MIQRPGNCPFCGYWEPFHPSWFTPEKEVADPKWVKEWDSELWDLLVEYRNLTVEHCDGDWLYHLTRTNKTVERYPMSVIKAGLSPAESVGKTWRSKE